MPGPWFSWTKGFSCKSDRDQVVEPRAIGGRRSESLVGKSKKHLRSGGCSRSISSLRDVIHGNTKVVHKQCTQPSFEKTNECRPEFRPNQVSSEPTYGVARNYCSTAGLDDAGARHGRSCSSLTSTPLSTGSGYSMKGTPLRKLSGCYDCNMAYETLDSQHYREGSLHSSYCGSPKAGCQLCGEVFSKSDSLEQHFTSQHAVTELDRGDSSRNVVEIIFRTSWLKKELPCGRIERILKIHSTEKTLVKFEEYRDVVKSRAMKMVKKHPRCMADGNELLRFYGTTVLCQLGVNGSSNLCLLTNCQCCQLIRSGFSAKETGKGIHTTATSGKAHDQISSSDEELLKGKRAMVVCRVIAGRTHKVYEEQELFSPPNGYDSVAGDSGPYSNIDELLVFNPRAVLPCFVVIYKC